jgi:hypothetical protein
LAGAPQQNNAEAYRYDRRKDMLLQEHSDFVLRFLAEDVGAQIDTIPRALLHYRDDRRSAWNMDIVATV